MSVVQTVHLKIKDVLPNQVIHGVQNDTDRVVKMVLDDLELSSGMTATLSFRRPDGTFYGITATPDTTTNSFSADLTQALTCPGRVTAQLKVVDTKTASTFSFYILVEKDASGVVSEQEGISLTTAVARAEDAADRAESAAEDVDTAIAAVQNIPDTIAPAFSTSAAYSVGDYVMYNGHLYRFTQNHAAGAWSSSDVEQVTATKVDATLSKKGMPSDAFETSTEIWQLNDRVFSDVVLPNDFIYGRYLSAGFYDNVTNYCRNRNPYPPGKYEIGPHASNGFIAFEYISDTQGSAIFANYVSAKQTITPTKPWYITFNSISGDSNVADINANMVVKRISTETDTLESKVNALENSDLFSSFSEVYSKNRYDGTYTDGGYVNEVSGDITPASGHSYTPYIDISNHGSANVVISNTHNNSIGYSNLRCAFYDSTKTKLSSGIAPTLQNDAVLERDYAVITTPSNAVYMRFSLPNAAFTTVTDWQIEYSSVTAYSAFSGDWSGISIGSLAENPTVDKFESATYGNKPPQASAATLSDGQILIVENNSVMKNQYMSFFGNITGSFDAVIVGHGQESYGYYIKVDDTNMTYGSNGSWGTAIAHGLTITDFIGVIVEVDVELNIKVTIVTKGGYFTRSQQINSSWRGNVFATSDGTSFTDAVLTWNTDDYKCPFWAFGDSYFTLYSPTRWTYYIAKEWGFNNILLNAYPGEASARALEDFKNALKHGIPKYVLWCMGMNDPDSSSAPNASWLQSIETVKGFCETYDIELIVTTIPIVTNASYKNTYKNEWIRSSGLRYVDFADALDNVDGWLSDDQIHPSEIGGRYMALYLMAEVPEITQGK